ncbi:trypsin-like serine peptidase [Roseicyclus mahoneyensis]|nr:trypsin-like serine protease [Roseicyclus mahoneyensis]
MTSVTRPEGSAALRGLHTADDARDWEAVGRLDTGVSFCTATLIAPDLVLTAAHCLFTEAGDRIADGNLTFSAGLRHGRAEAIRGVAQSRVPQGYARPVGQADMQAIAQDLAVLRLDRAVSSGTVRPIAVGAAAPVLSAVTLVSYGAEREAFPSIEDDCRVLSGFDTVQVLSCHVVSGSSGAPVVRIGPEGPQIVAIVSGRSDMAEGDVTVAVVAETLVEALIAAPAAPVARSLQGSSITIRRVGDVGASREGMGARFIRP